MRAWLTINRRRKIYERKYTALVQRSLKIQIAPIIDELATRKPSQIEVILDPEPIKKAFGLLYPDTGRAFAQVTHRELTGKALKDDLTSVWDNEMRAFMEMHAGERITSITGSSKEIAMRILKDLGMRVIPEGLSIEEATRLLQSEFKKRYIETTIARARVIAQTEILTASNKGSSMGALEAGATIKEWQTSGIASPDGKDRHIAYPGLHGQVRAINEKYDVGGYPADYPGDPTLPAGEVVNCKCAEIYKI